MINVCLLGGELCKPPRINYVSSRKDYVCDFTLKVKNHWRATNGQQMSNIVYANCKLWGNKARWFAEYVDVGDMVTVDGQYMVNRVASQNGSKHFHFFSVKKFSLMSKKTLDHDIPADLIADFEDLEAEVDRTKKPPE